MIYRLRRLSIVEINITLCIVTVLNMIYGSEIINAARCQYGLPYTDKLIAGMTPPQADATQSGSGKTTKRAIAFISTIWRRL